MVLSYFCDCLKLVSVVFFQILLTIPLFTYGLHAFKDMGSVAVNSLVKPEDLQPSTSGSATTGVLSVRQSGM